MTLVVGLLHGATFLSNLPLVLFVSFIGPWQLERTPIKPVLQLQFPGGQFPWYYLGLLGLVPIVAAIAGFCVYKKKQRGEVTKNGNFQ